MKSFKLLTSMKWILFFFSKFKGINRKINSRRKSMKHIDAKFSRTLFLLITPSTEKIFLYFFKSSMFPSQKNECIFLRMTEKC